MANNKPIGLKENYTTGIEPMPQAEFCPLSLHEGELLRSRVSTELIHSYSTYLGGTLPTDLVQKYFQSDLNEYCCPNCGLRWYAPALMGGSEYYEWLAGTFNWYYRPASWDKKIALKYLLETNGTAFVEMGSGSGDFLRLTERHAISGVGIEINTTTIQTCNNEGLAVYHESEIDSIKINPDTLVLLQILEHTTDPLNFLGSVINRFSFNTILISVPCHESLLGYANDPLSWPPHHFTSWSEKALRTLANKLGYMPVAVHYEPLSFQEYMSRRAREPNGDFLMIPKLPSGQVGYFLFRLLKKLNVSWASRAHSIFIVLKRI